MNLTATQSAKFRKSVFVRQPGGLPKNLEGFSVKSVIRNSRGAKAADNFNTAIADPKQGWIIISLPSTHELLPGLYAYEVDVESDTERTTVAFGELTVRPSLFTATVGEETERGDLTVAIDGAVQTNEVTPVPLVAVIGGTRLALLRSFGAPLLEPSTALESPRCCGLLLTD